MLLYGLNPLILVELLSNVHNDIYLILFILLAFYFLIRKKNIYFTIAFLALSIAIKYSTVLIVPFILLYYFRKYSIPKRILYCMLSGISIIGIVIILYLPYYRDISIFANMLVQDGKYTQSIMALLLVKIKNKDLFNLVSKLKLPIFAISYTIVIIQLLLKNKLTIKQMMKKYNWLMLIFIFFILSTFQKWYVLWLIPTLPWQSKQMRKFILALTVAAIIPSWNYFKTGNDAFLDGIYYSLEMLLLSVICILVNIQLKRLRKERKN